MTLANPNRTRLPHRTGSNRPSPRPRRFEWAEAEILAAASIVDDLRGIPSATARTVGEAVLEALAPFIAELERAAAAKALREAADGIEHPDGPFGIGGEGQDAADWLRDRADRIEGGW